MQTLTLTKTESPRSVAAGAGVCDADSNPSPDSAASDIASGVQPLRSSYSRRAVNLDRASAPAASNKNSFPRAMGHATCLTESHWDAESHKAHWGSGACVPGLVRLQQNFIASPYFVRAKPVDYKTNSVSSCMGDERGPVAVEDVAVWMAGARYTVRSGVIQFPQAPRAIHATARGPPVLPLRAIPPGPVTAQTGGGARCEWRLTR
ncbi:hypothetical protein ACCO45_001238 [Purpureocillium lilacinum]|uniref:Uncharacterized protein n=1 Tax=Purpureocillium lilacinum TaxID=33203 RepID=A0ACC4E6G2_PURLI